jgi:hypothetical protein
VRTCGTERVKLTMKEPGPVLSSYVVICYLEGIVQPHCQSQLISLGRGDHMSRVIAQQEMDDPLQ